ncbi:hypothetical protein EON67_04615, partial [archaeon]
MVQVLSDVHQKLQAINDTIARVSAFDQMKEHQATVATKQLRLHAALAQQALDAEERQVAELRDVVD